MPTLTDAEAVSQVGMIVTLCCVHGPIVDGPPVITTIGHDSPELDAALDDALCHWGDRSAWISWDREIITSFFTLTERDREQIKAVIA